MKDTYTKLEVIEMLKPIVNANDKIQLWIEYRPLTTMMLKDLDELDNAIRNVGKKYGNE
jgi:hypothetical protein